MVVVLPTPVGPISATMCGPTVFVRTIGPDDGKHLFELLGQLLADEMLVAVQMLGPQLFAAAS